MWYRRQELLNNEETLKKNSQELERWKVNQIELALEFEVCELLHNEVSPKDDFCFDRYV